MVENVLMPSRKILPVNWHHGSNEERVGGSSSPFSLAPLSQLLKMASTGLNHDFCMLGENWTS